MINEKNSTNNKNTKDVIEANNLGVFFESGNFHDDYKSRLINLFKKGPKAMKKEKFWSLKEIDFSGHKGEILGIIGANGAGKTTLSKVVAGILHEDKGTIHVDGKVTALFSFGMGFRRDLTGRENVYLNGMMLRSEEHTSELQSRGHLVCRLLLEKKKCEFWRVEFATMLDAPQAVSFAQGSPGLVAVLKPA